MLALIVTAALQASEVQVVDVGLRMQSAGVFGGVVGGHGRTSRVHLVIDSNDRSTEIVRVVGVSQGVVGNYVATVVQTERLCRAPCNADVEVDSESDYYVHGSTDEPIDLLAQGRSINVKVQNGSIGARGGGIALISLGGASVLSGALLMLFGALLNTSDSVYSAPLSGFNGVLLAGVVCLAAGAVALASGIPLIMLNRMKVTTSPGDAALLEGDASSAPINSM